MPLLTIDTQPVTFQLGATILDAARQAGVEIPTLCHLDGHPPQTSCYLCVVRVNGGARLVPACATKAAEGMAVESETEAVRAARRTAIELLLSDHLGDCIGPCRGVCPAHMDMPAMIRHVAAGRLREAVAVVKERIPLPAALGRVCPELCEKGCRRAALDGPVSVCMLKRFVGDADLASGDPYLPPCLPASGKRVAIAGAGPAGLSTAYYLLQRGHACTLYDAREHPGGGLRHGVSPDVLPPDVLDAEIEVIRRLGAQFRLGVRVGADIPLEDLRRECDAVLLAVGEVAPEGAAALGVERAGAGLKANRRTFATSLPGVFAAGSSIAPSQYAVRAVADGRAAALAITRYLAEEAAPEGEKEWSVHVGRLEAVEAAPFAAVASPEARVMPAGGIQAGFTEEEARREARRCLGCDCRHPETCRLRHYAEQYDANPLRFRGERRAFAQDNSHPLVVFQSGKCIACGICVRIAAASGEETGVAFTGRGFGARPAVPFGGALSEGLRRAALACAEACPTGALTRRDDAEP